MDAIAIGENRSEHAGKMTRENPSSEFARAPLLFPFWKVLYLNLLQILCFQLVSVAEDAGLSLAFPETPKTGFVTLRPICKSYIPWIKIYHK